MGKMKELYYEMMYSDMSDNYDYKEPIKEDLKIKGIKNCFEEKTIPQLMELLLQHQNTLATLIGDLFCSPSLDPEDEPTTSSTPNTVSNEIGFILSEMSKINDTLHKKL